jgi:hypothetical protein
MSYCRITLRLTITTCLPNYHFRILVNQQQIARKGIASTISIVTLDKNMQPLGFGSVIVDNQTIVTNVHVVGGNKVYILNRMMTQV